MLLVIKSACFFYYYFLFKKKKKKTESFVLSTINKFCFFVISQCWHYLVQKMATNSAEVLPW